MNNMLMILKKSVIIFFICTSYSVYASIVIGGTRVVYEGEKKEISISIDNPTALTYLIQSWVDSPYKQSPFIITPPLVRLEGGQSNRLRIIKMPSSLPEDKESLFWINIKAIPSIENNNNTLQIAIKSRLKLIYRPKILKEGNPEKVSYKLKWKKIGKQLQITNPTPYYMNFHHVYAGSILLEQVTYIAPFSSVTYALPAATENQLHWSLINDYGSCSDTYYTTIK